MCNLATRTVPVWAQNVSMAKQPWNVARQYYRLPVGVRDGKPVSGSSTASCTVGIKRLKVLAVARKTSNSYRWKKLTLSWGPLQGASPTKGGVEVMRYGRSFGDPPLSPPLPRRSVCWLDLYNISPGGSGHRSCATNEKIVQRERSGPAEPMPCHVVEDR